MVGQLCHEEGFPHLWRTGKQICPRIEQAVNNRLLALINRLVQLIHRNRMQIGRVLHSLHLKEKFFLRNVLQVIDFRRFTCYNLSSL